MQTLSITSSGYLADHTSTLSAFIETKQLLDEVFMNYILMIDHHAEWPMEFKEQIYLLWTCLREILDEVAVQQSNGKLS